MAKVKNDPRKYLKRSDLAPRRATADEKASGIPPHRLSDAFLVAPIDRNFYIDFRPTRPKESKR